MKTDFCVIGGGIAGLSIAAELSQKAKVVLLEREQDLAYHTTGRSAALYSDITASSTALALSKLTRPFLLDPPEGFSEYPLFDEIGCIFVARDDQADLIETESAKIDRPQILDAEQILASVPIMRTGGNDITAGLLEEYAFRIDVAALVQGYRNQARRNDATIQCQAEVTALTYENSEWKVQLSNGDSLTANKIINASGAWGDVIGELAGAKPIGLSPYRRNIIVFDGPSDIDMSRWPAIGSITMDYYFLPEAGRLMGSSADEVPSEPCDAQPEEYDIALAAHNIESATTLSIDHIHHKWAGLRTFAPDRQLVAGYDADCPGFFWYVGQGGFGIQTSHASARAAALLALEESLPLEYEEAGVNSDALSSNRFSSG